MKKESLQGLLSVLAGIVGAVIITAFMFKNLQWPGGDLLMAIITPILLLVQAISISVYVALFGALKSNGKSVAKHLHRVEIVAIIILALFIIALIFRIYHWPGGALLVLVTCLVLSILSLIAGFLGCKLCNAK